MMELPPIHHGGHPQMVSSVAAIVNDQDVVGPQGPLDEVFSLEQVVMETSRQIRTLFKQVPLKLLNLWKLLFMEVK
jgi:hypothetical protein